MQSGQLSALQQASKTPGCLDVVGELRKTLLDFIADFANWDHATDSVYLAVGRTLTVAVHDALEGINVFWLIAD